MVPSIAGRCQARRRAGTVLGNRTTSSRLFAHPRTAGALVAPDARSSRSILECQELVLRRGHPKSTHVVDDAISINEEHDRILSVEELVEEIVQPPHVGYRALVGGSRLTLSTGGYNCAGRRRCRERLRARRSTAFVLRLLRTGVS